MFNSTNPKHIEYHTESLAIAVLGGINLYHFDRLRVTLKVSKNDKEATWAVRHNIDLYHDVAVEKLTRRIAERLEIGTSHIRRAIHDLTTLLEQYRIEQTKEDNTQFSLSDKAEKQAIKFLKSKKLIQRTQQLIEQSGIVGEIDNRLLMYLIFTSRKTNHPLHCISIGSSGIGKSHLQNNLARLMPPEDILEITALTANALYYFGKDELNYKILLLEDLDGADKALYPIRELQTRRRITKTIVQKTRSGENRTIQRIVEGLVTIAGCTTKENLYEDNSNRSFLLYLDESHEQDKRIMHYQQKLLAGNIDLQAQMDARQLLQNVQRCLQTISVRNPYAEYLTLPMVVFKPRRTNTHYLYLVNTIAFYYQHQREILVDTDTGEQYIEVTIDDIKMANKLIKETLLIKSDHLTANCRAYYESLKQYLKDKPTETFTAMELRKHLRLSKTSQWRYHRQLMDYGYMERKGRNTPAIYVLKQFEDYKHWEIEIDKVLNDSIKAIENVLKNRSTVPDRST